ncbi:MAG: mandelate racemase [Rhodospirillaceae bacterium]|nr:mandelate racemase [Rhodospirillaceae bacterium]
MNHPRLTFKSVRARSISVPMNRPLGTSSATMDKAPFLLLDLYTDEGVVGHAHIFCYRDFAAPLIRKAVEVAGELLVGAPLQPEIIKNICGSYFMLLGNQGIVGMAISGLDVACWDALAKASGLPLSQYLGSDIQSLSAYNSNGLSISSNLADKIAIAEEAQALLEQGFKALKIRLGREDHAEDVKAVKAVREVISSGTALMSDYNQALSLSEALERGLDLQQEGLYWIEEPLPYQDLEGNAQVVKTLQVPIQNGENYSSPDFLSLAMKMKSMDYIMIDLMRIGGVSGWMQAAELAKEADLLLSSHLYPEVSAHLLAASTTSHWLEYIDWAEIFIAEPVSISDGIVKISASVGTGVAWQEDVVTHYELD